MKAIEFSNLESPPSTAAYIRLHALMTPDALALLQRGDQVSYRRLHDDVTRFTRALRRIGLKRAATVAIECEEIYIHWLLILACENLGLGYGSFLWKEDSGASYMLEFVDLILAHAPPPGAPLGKLFLLTDQWIAETLSGEAGDEEYPAAALDDPHRICRSSGATSGPKMMITTRRYDEHQIGYTVLFHGLNFQTRLLAVSSFFHPSSVTTACSVWRARGTIIIENGTDMREAISRHNPSHMRLNLREITLLAEAWTPEFRRPDNLVVRIGGAPLPPPLRQLFMKLVASEIVHSYGTTEAGRCCQMDPEGVGTLIPGVRVEIVDGEDRLVPDGSVGHIRVRSPGMITEYVGNPEASRRNFRKGWFYPGDLGIAVGPSRIRILGRDEQSINIGGMKFVTTEIEEKLLRTAGLKEVAVTSVPDRLGVERVVVAIVLGENRDIEAICSAIVATLDEALGGCFVFTLPELPRTETGKIRIAAVRAAAKSLLKQS